LVNAHRMLHWAWEDFETWKWVHHNVAKNAHPPSIPRKGRKVWSVAQLRTFLDRARHDRFYPLWVLEAITGMRRCELAGVNRDGLDLDAATLAIEVKDDPGSPVGHQGRRRSSPARLLGT
jgi:integrase